jgi:GLPGLI family protein
MRIKFILFYSVFVIASLKAVTQNTINIHYKQRSYYKLSSGNSHSIDMDWRLVFNDSLSLCYIVTNEIEDKKIELEEFIGQKLFHHGVLYDLKNDILYEEVNRTDLRKKYITISKQKKIIWTYTTEAKIILDNDCKLAIGVIENSKDTLHAWYSLKLTKPFGPINFTWGLPGVVLQAYIPKYDMHLYATKISNSNQILEFPTSAKIKKDK